MLNTDRCDYCGQLGTDFGRFLVITMDERYGTESRAWLTLCQHHSASLELLAEQVSLLRITTA